MATEMDLDKLQNDIECDRFSMRKWALMMRIMWPKGDCPWRTDAAA